MDGETKTMPLSVCAKPSRPSSGKPRAANPITFKINSGVITAFADDERFLWKRDLKGSIAHVEIADLNGDGANEVIAGIGVGGEDSGKIIVLNAAGDRLWATDTNPAATEDTTRVSVKTFTIGDLFRKGTRQIVALSNGTDAASPSRLTVLSNEGKVLSTYRHPGALQDVIIATLTARHAPRIFVTAVNTTLNSILGVDEPVATILSLDPKNIRSGTQLWYGTVLPAAQTIDKIEIVDHDNDSQRDIAIVTSTGSTFHLDFDGRIIGTSHPEGAARAHFGLVSLK
jgi:hypothetical protein